MIVQFSIYPSDDTHISDDLSKVKDILSDSGLEYQIGPIGTCVQGEWESVMKVIRHCHTSMKRNHARLLTTIVIDDRKVAEHSLRGAVESVEKKDQSSESASAFN